MTQPLSEEALRALVRETIARIETGSAPAMDRPRALPLASHPSHDQYALQPSDGPCFIEPGVRCNHCGYCQSHGH